MAFKMWYYLHSPDADNLSQVPGSRFHPADTTPGLSQIQATTFVKLHQTAGAVITSLVHFMCSHR